MSKLNRIIPLVLILLVFSFLSPSVIKAQTSSIPAIEKEALVALYNSTDGENWNRNDGWLIDPNPCNWYGVICGVGHVEELKLDWNNLSGSIPPEIGNLTNLEYLSLSDNQLTNLPPEIGNLSNLDDLDLSINQLTSLPPEIGNLLNLWRIYFHDNQLTSLPPEIGNLTNLEWLSLGSNQLTSLPPEIGNLANLGSLHLGINQLTSLPSEIWNLTNLDDLYLHDNQLTSLPPELGHLSNLWILVLDNNQLTSIPPEIGNLTNLTNLSLRSNQLTSLPSEIGNLTNLEWLSLGSNQLTNLPSEIGNLLNLQSLYLEINQLTSLPPEIGNLTNLGDLYLPDNQLTSLPPEIGNLTNLWRIDFHDNQLTSLPPEIGNLLNLWRINFHDNQLTSLPPEIGNLTNLGWLDLSLNKLNSIPSEIGNLMNLWYLSLENNQLTSLPPEIGDLINLHHLDLSENSLSGEIPNSITEMAALRYWPCWNCTPYADFGYNMLYSTNSSVIEFMNAVDPDWSETQTIAPSDISIIAINPTAVELSWTPIPYTEDGGYYQISYAQQAGGSYTIHGTTSDKTPSSYIANDLSNENSYYFVVQTFTPAHDEQKNELLSEYSTEVEGILPIFWDVLPAHWAVPFVETIYYEGITTGCSADPLMYCPKKNTTRAETAVFLEKGMHGAGFFPPDVSPTFGDTTGHWAEDWIEALFSDGMTSGCSQDPLLFCPDSSTTRAEMAVFLLKARHGNTYTPPAPDGSHPFSDIGGHWAEAWIEQLAAEGITGGYPDGTYRPENQVTRAEMAVFLVNTFNLPVP